MSISETDKKKLEPTTVEKQLFRGFIRIHILHHASQEQVFGQELKAELERHGYRLSYGTLYPILHRMEKDGLLILQTRTVSGKVRKYYEATLAGKRMLSKAKEYIRELVDEVVGGSSQ